MRTYQKHEGKEYLEERMGFWDDRAREVARIAIIDDEATLTRTFDSMHLLYNDPHFGDPVDPAFLDYTSEYGLKRADTNDPRVKQSIINEIYERAKWYGHNIVLVSSMSTLNGGGEIREIKEIYESIAAQMQDAFDDWENLVRPTIRSFLWGRDNVQQVVSLDQAYDTIIAWWNTLPDIPEYDYSKHDPNDFDEG